VRGRHPDVDDGEVGPQTVDKGQQRLDVAGLPDDVVAGLGQPAARGGDPVLQTAQAGAERGVRTARAVVADLDGEDALVVPDRDGRRRDRRVPGRVGQRLVRCS